MKTPLVDGVEVDVEDVLVHVVVVTGNVVEVVVQVKRVVEVDVFVFVDVGVRVHVAVRVVLEVVSVRDVVVAVCVAVLVEEVLVVAVVVTVVNILVEAAWTSAPAGATILLLAPSDSCGASCKETVALPTPRDPVVMLAMPRTRSTCCCKVSERLEEERRRRLNSWTSTSGGVRISAFTTTEPGNSATITCSCVT
jgi:hypothetical protein